MDAVGVSSVWSNVSLVDIEAGMSPELKFGRARLRCSPTVEL